MSAASRTTLGVAVALFGALTVIALVRLTSPADGAEDAWTAAAPSLLERAENGSAQIGDEVYVVGGLRAPDGRTTRAVLRYDMGENSWDEVAPIPKAVDHPGVTAAGGLIYVYGGRRGDRTAVDRFFRYDPVADAWTRLEDGPVARGAFVFEALEGKLYAAGGRSNSSERMRRLDVYNIAQERWRRKAPMDVGRNHIAGGFLDGELFVTGGRPGPVLGARATVESYDPATGEWQGEPRLDHARSGHEAVIVDGRLLIFGGEETDREQGDVIDEVEIFDGTDWDSSSLPEMATPRHGVAGGVDGNRVYVIEGGPQRGLSWSNLVEFLDVPPA